MSGEGDNWSALWLSGSQIEALEQHMAERAYLSLFIGSLFVVPFTLGIDIGLLPYRVVWRLIFGPRDD